MSDDGMQVLTTVWQGDVPVHTYVYLTGPVPRPKANRVVLVHIDGIEVEWPEGMTAREALLAWAHSLPPGTEGR